MAKRSIYRDSETGRFVKKSTWERSRSHGGERFSRQRVSVSSGASPRIAAPVPSGAFGGGGQVVDIGGGGPDVAPAGVGGGGGGNVIGSLEEFYDFSDYDYDVDEFDTGIDYETGTT